MASDANGQAQRLTGHALRNAHLRQRALARARSAPPLARTLVRIRADTLGLTRLELARRSGISRGTLRDVELGIHTPTRRTLQQFVAFCQRNGVPADQVEELRRLYAGVGETLGELLARLELRAGSPRELARRVGISPATLWEYRRGNFPLPLSLLIRLCEAAGEDATPAELVWHRTERQRLLDRGYPESLAEFWVLCARAGIAERHLLERGLATATVRRLRYLEVPPWEQVKAVARTLCRDEAELCHLRELWERDERRHGRSDRDGFGPRLLQMRKKQGVSRRELADLFDLKGKKPARVIKAIEEDGFYSAQAFPAGLAALVTDDDTEQTRLLELWQKRRRLFHARHRPETRLDLRLRRELFGFELSQMQEILGYTSQEYQRIERGVTPLSDTARSRIVEALDRAGRQRVATLLDRRKQRDQERIAWRSPGSARALVALLARREGGYIPLARLLRQAGLRGVWAGRLRGIGRGDEVPTWHLLEQIARVGGILDSSTAYQDWADRYRALLQVNGSSPLGVEVRLLIAEVSSTPSSFSGRLEI